MSKSSMTFFPVGNGDMTLVSTAKEYKILVDCNIKNEENSEYDCKQYLHDNLPKDKGITYVEAMVLTHSDQDHCRGVADDFNLCKPADVDKTKITIREMIVPARLLIDDELKNDDAKAIRKEADRRLALYDKKEFDLDGNRLQIVGYSEELKQYSKIIVPAGEEIKALNGIEDYGLRIMVLGPVKKNTDDEQAGINDASISLKLTFCHNNIDTIAILGGDLICDNWIDIIEKNPDMEFDILLAPHHCSWHALSNEDKSTGKVAKEISDFLERSKERAYIVSSSKKIKKNDDNPPSYRAKNEYLRHVKNDDRFVCLADYPNDEKNEPYILTISQQGVSVSQILQASVKTSKSNIYTPKTYGMRG